ncbi:hypothetical protein BT67DRAFT_240854 [Trichocladium antarcticum]|uniref:Uncharacterized protein n=1 Tax=Trichocladium antarcticum TaxID=1450529 RepID=A0AAN6Z9M4_9PEZI|nr:hypothetical protein BT67DRAFT_240854 [Trichocladium antarcticum]
MHPSDNTVSGVDGICVCHTVDFLTGAIFLCWDRSSENVRRANQLFGVAVVTPSSHLGKAAEILKLPRWGNIFRARQSRATQQETPGRQGPSIEQFATCLPSCWAFLASKREAQFASESRRVDVAPTADGQHEPVGNSSRPGVQHSTRRRPLACSRRYQKYEERNRFAGSSHGRNGDGVARLRQPVEPSGSGKGSLSEAPLQADVAPPRLFKGLGTTRLLLGRTRRSQQDSLLQAVHHAGTETRDNCASHAVAGEASFQRYSLT